MTILNKVISSKKKFPTNCQVLPLSGEQAGHFIQGRSNNNNNNKWFISLKLHFYEWEKLKKNVMNLHVEHNVSIVKWRMHSTLITITCLASHAATKTGTWVIKLGASRNKFIEVDIVFPKVRYHSVSQLVSNTIVIVQ